MEARGAGISPSVKSPITKVCADLLDGPVNLRQLQRSVPPLLLLVHSTGTLAGCGSADTLDLVDGGARSMTVCSNDDVCALDQHCDGQVCVAGTGNECTISEECGPGRECSIVTGCGAARCHGNVCVDSPPPPCTNDRDCTAEATICVLGACAPEVSCMRSSECPADRRCIRRACRAPCAAADDCGPAFAWSCNASTGDCQQRCNNDAICPEGTICESLLCVPAECANDSSCVQGSNEECDGEENGHGRCVAVVACSPEGECPPGNACNLEANRCEPLPRCAGDRGCGTNAYCEGGFCQPALGCAGVPCPTGFDCVGALCVPEVCRGDADCASSTTDRCIGGACRAPPPTTLVTSVRILTPAGSVRPGSSYAFTAVALDQTGSVVPGATFIWSSSDANVAGIDGSGVATGGQAAGTAVITASLFNGATNIISPGVTLSNLGALASGDVRVSVVSLASGSPISGASVEITGSFGTRSAVTTGSGIALFTGLPSPLPSYGVTAGHPLFDFVSVLGLDRPDILIALPPVRRPSIAAGIKGNVDFSQVATEGALSMSLSGASMPSPLVSFDPSLLFGGDLFLVTVPNPMGGGTITVPVAAGGTLAFDLAGSPIPLKDTYYARAETGLRAAWSFAGRVGFDTFMAGGAGGLTNIVGAILPFLQRFDHGVRPVVDVVALPTIPDATDIDGDGDTMEIVPNYASFPSVPIAPDTEQSLRYQLAVDNLPFVSGGNSNTLIVVAGMLLPSVGFVPLGLDGLQDDLGNGIVPPFTTKVAPPHGGLEVGEYAVLATAVRLEPGALPGPGSARLVVASRLPEIVDVSDGWLDSPIGATWVELSRTISLSSTQSDVDFYRIAFASSDGAWHVYTALPPGSTPSIPIPTAPAGLVDRTSGATITIDAMDLEASTSPSALFDLSSGGALALDHATRGFARAVVMP